MEFPGLGDHCSKNDCKILDFLPFKCEACKLIFCKNHFYFDRHDCEKAHQFDNQVPVCPLCNKPVPFKKNELPDIQMNRHIENDCEDDRALKKRNGIYKNKCNLKLCRQKEIIPVLCRECKLNFCLKHRHPSDHQCMPNKIETKEAKSADFTSAGFQATNSAIKRITAKNIKETTNSVMQKIGILFQDKGTTETNTNEMTTSPNAFSRDVIQLESDEDEALAKAISISLTDNLDLQPKTKEQEDQMIAQAIELSTRTKRKEKCDLI